MLRYFLLIAIQFISSLKADAKLLKDPAQARKIADKIVSHISVKCKMNDTIKKELRNLFYDYYLKCRILIISEEDKLVLEQKLVPIKIEFIKTLKQKFGNEVYRCYKNIISCKYPILIEKLN